MENTFIDIKVNEKDEYLSVVVTVNNEKKDFNSGDFVKDWFDAMHYSIFQEHGLSLSSSVDGFLRMNTDYTTTYLRKVDGVYDLYYDNKDIDEDEIRFFVNKDEKPTWKELKDRYLHNK